MKKILLLILLFSSSVLADTANISYVAPTERVDNTPLLPSEIGGFKVYDNSGVMIRQLPADARGFTMTTTSVIQNLFITAIDTDGRESSYSQAAVVPASIAVPKSVTGITVTVTP